MQKRNGLRKYFYEGLYYDAISQARSQTGMVIPISQAKEIRARVDEHLSTIDASSPGLTMANPDLQVSHLLTAVDAAIGESVPGYQPVFANADGGHSPTNENYQRLQAAFMSRVGFGSRPSPSPALPISPYDPDWSERATIKNAGTALSYVPDETIERAVGGQTGRLSSPECGPMMVWKLDGDGKAVESGRAMSDEDASGLTALMDKMSAAEYDQVRNWVIDGGRDPRTGRIDRNRFMSPAALGRSVAILEELQSQGLDYEVLKDQNPGQIKARVSGTGMNVRLTETRDHEDYAGARIYDNGMVMRYSTNHKIGGGKYATHTPSPAEAVDLLRFCQGRPLQRKDQPGVAVGATGSTHTEMARRGRDGPLEPSEIEDSYHVGKISMFAIADHRVAGEQPRDGSKVFIRRNGTDRSLPEYFVDAEPAEAYLAGAVDSARANLSNALDVEGLIADYERQRPDIEFDGAETLEPEFSADTEVAAIQRSYWDILAGNREQLLRPGATEEMYQQRLGAIGELSAEDGVEPDFGNLIYGGSSPEKVRAHADEVLDEVIGTIECESRVDAHGQLVEQRFDPMRVAKYMTSSSGQWSNLDNLASALRRINVAPSEMMGTGFQSGRFKDRLVRFNESASVPVNEHDSDFIRRAGQTVVSSLQRNAVEEADVRIDDQSVIKWRGQKMRRDGSASTVSGEIGQIFDVGDHGEIVTEFAGGENALIVPGYEARIAAQVPGETGSVEERTLLRGYEQMMTEQIEYQVASDLVSGRSEVGEGASLNGVYSKLYGTKHPVDFIEQHREYDGQGAFDFDEPAANRFALDPWIASTLATEARRVRYSNDIKAGSTVYAEHRAQSGQADPADDNHFDAWRLTGGRNMAVLTGVDENGIAAQAGYFDPVMTGSATNQGIVRYLTTDAQVSTDGRISPGDPETVTGARAPLMTRPELETMQFDPFDRQQMTASTLMQSSKVTSPTGTAMMTFGGWTADDPIVISREFSEGNRIHGAGGGMRDLVAGDKLSDLHGNKGVVSLVVDRDMEPEQARRQDLEQEVAWFRDNPDMDVVMSPFSLISRRNAGSAREMLGGEVSDLHAPGTDAAQSGTLGQMRFMVTHMAVDEKTKIYDDEDVSAGRGRKASSQLAWALQSQDSPAIMAEFYGHNSGAEANLREFMLTVGVDMEADGTLRVVGRDEDHTGLSHEGIDDRPERRLFAMPDLVHTSNGGLHTTAMRRSFGELIGDKGGDLEIPFPLTYPTGEQTEPVTDSSWKMPVLSSHLRSGQEFEDGTTVTHDYTNRYLDVHMQACKYRSMQKKLDGGSLSQDKREELTDGMGKAAVQAQRKFESITGDLQNRVFSQKKNIFKTGLMSSKLADSATAVWTADPRLDIDQVALSPVMAGQLGLAEDDHALIWRDPVLRDAGMRYMRVAVDERLTGVAINPVMDQCFDGDFDGDAVAVVRLHHEAAKTEAMDKLSVPANLLDTGVKSEAGTHPFAMQISLDTQAALSKSSELRDELDSLSGETNLAVMGADSEPDDVTRARYEDITGQLSDFYRDAQRNEFGSALRFDDQQAHLDSVEAVCVDTGAKGNQRKLDDYARYLGEDGQPGMTRADQEASMFATAIKAHGTGLGGSYSQRAVRALGNKDLKAVLEVTYPVTQSILQSKHSASEARHKYDMLQGPGRDLWRGRKLEHDGPGSWKPVFEDGEPVAATEQEWTGQFIDFYEAPDGFNVSVNPEYVERVAAALTDPKTGRVRNLEEDVSLQGSLMDRMAYGGDFSDLLTAADNHENLFDGDRNEQFASIATAAARTETRTQLDRLAEPGFEPAEPVIADAVIKRDVIAGDHVSARARGEGRRSKQAVAAGGPRSQPVAATAGAPSYTPSIAITTPTADDEYEMGG